MQEKQRREFMGTIAIPIIKFFAFLVIYLLIKIAIHFL